MRFPRICGKEIKLKKLTPLDFIDYPGGVPFSIFKTKKGMTMYEQVMQTTNAEKESIENEKMVNELVIKGLVDKSLFEVLNKEEKSLVACYVIAHSTCLFKDYVNTDRNAIFGIDIIAKRYGKSPIEILFPFGGYNEMDAYLFNVHVACAAINEEVRIQKLQEAKMKSDSRGRR